MRNALTGTTRKQHVPGSTEVRYRNKGTSEAFRPATILGGDHAEEQARTMAREFACTYGDLEFAVFTNGELLETVDNDPPPDLHPAA